MTKTTHASTCKADGCNTQPNGQGKYCYDHSPRRLRDVPVIERILARVPQGNVDECWPWRGYVNARGYGVFRHDSTGNLSAHREVYAHLVGEIPEGKVLDHTCYNTRCCNPHHLRPIAPKENVENFSEPVRANNTSGYRGVSLHSSGLYAAVVTHNYKPHLAGYFRTPEEAGEAARKLRLELHSYNDLDRAS